LLWGCVDPVADLVQSFVEVPYGRASRSLRRRSARFLLRLRWAFLALIESSTGALADALSSEMSSRYRLGRASDVTAFPIAMNTLQSGVQSSESVVATSVGEYSSAVGVSGVPSCKGSVSR
jgi:hypothetical protein